MHPSEIHVAVITQNADVMTDMRPQAMARALADVGYHVSLVGPTRTAAAESFPGVFLAPFRLPTPAGSAAGQVREQVQATIRAAAVLIRIARRAPIHAIHVGNPPDNGVFFRSVVRMTQGFPPVFVYDQHDPAPLIAAEKYGKRPALRLVTRMLELLERLSLGRADLVVFANEPFLARAQKAARLRGNVAVASNGWRLPPPASEALPWRDVERPMLTYVGTTNAQDCILHMVEAVALLQRPVQVVVAGDGDARASAMSLADRLGVTERFVWLGWVDDRSVISQIVRDAAVCIAPETPSPTNDLTTFVKVVEYMSVGAPTVAHRLAQTETLAGNTLEYAADDSAASLADALERLLSDPEHGVALGLSARVRFDESLSWEANGAKRLVESYAREVLPAVARNLAKGRRTTWRRIPVKARIGAE